MTDGQASNNQGPLLPWLRKLRTSPRWVCVSAENSCGLTVNRETRDGINVKSLWTAGINVKLRLTVAVDVNSIVQTRKASNVLALRVRSGCDIALPRVFQRSADIDPTKSVAHGVKCEVDAGALRCLGPFPALYLMHSFSLDSGADRSVRLDGAYRH
jgi:hypothetical protein